MKKKILSKEPQAFCHKGNINQVTNEARNKCGGWDESASLLCSPCEAWALHSPQAAPPQGPCDRRSPTPDTLTALRVFHKPGRTVENKKRIQKK